MSITIGTEILKERLKEFELNQQALVFMFNSVSRIWEQKLPDEIVTDTEYEAGHFNNDRIYNCVVSGKIVQAIFISKTIINHRYTGSIKFESKQKPAQELMLADHFRKQASGLRLEELTEAGKESLEGLIYYDEWATGEAVKTPCTEAIIGVGTNTLAFYLGITEAVKLYSEAQRLMLERKAKGPHYGSCPT